MSDTSETFNIHDKSQNLKYIVVKKKTERTYSLQELRSLFEDLRDALNRYADTLHKKLFCYHENIVFPESRVELLAHTVDCCDPEKLLEKIQSGESVPQGTDEDQSQSDTSGICNQCGNLTDPDQNYCLDCFDLLDHHTIAADLREQKRLLEVAAYYGTKECVSTNLMNSIAKSLELNIQMNADLDQNNAAHGGCAMQQGREPVTTSLPSHTSPVFSICAWCSPVSSFQEGIRVTHAICDFHKEMEIHKGGLIN